MRKPGILHYGDTLPPATEFEDGDLFFLRTAGELYIRTGGAWALSASSSMITSVQNDGTGVELVSDTGTSNTAKVRTLTTTGNGVSPAVSSGGGEVELSFDKVAAGWGAANGFATLDGSTKVVERLSYEGIANGVATLDANALLNEFPQLANIAALRAATGIGPTVVYIRGYYSDGDGGEGLFYYDASDTTSTDNGGTIIVDVDGKRWKRQFTGAVSVKWFGAKGDGTTDDTAAIQNAIDYSITSIDNNRAVFFPVGTYKITGQINIPFATGWKIFGEGASSSKIVQYTDNTPIFVLTQDLTHSWTISDMYLLWNTAQPATNTNARAIFCQGSGTGSGIYLFTIRNVRIENGYAGITANPASATPVWGGVIERVSSSIMSGPTVDLRQGTSQGQPNNRLSSIYIDGGSIDAAEYALAFNACNNLSLSNIEINHGDCGFLLLTGGCSATIENIRAESMNFVNKISDFIYATDSDFTVSNLRLSGSTVNVGVGNKFFLVNTLSGTHTVNITNVSTSINNTITSGTPYIIKAGASVKTHIDGAIDIGSFYLLDNSATDTATRVYVPTWNTPNALADHGDADYTIQESDPQVHLWKTALTAVRSAILPDKYSNNVFDGMVYRIVKNNGATGSDLNVVSNGATLYTIPGTSNQAVTVVYKRFGWEIIDISTLP